MNDIKRVAGLHRDPYPEEEARLLALKPVIVSRGYLTKDDLGAVAHWKARRSAGRMETNSEHYVREVTGFALSATTERARIEALTLLDGVQWPTASVILHFFHRNRYPILDFRALWSVSITPPPAQYDFHFWWEYVQFCQNLSDSSGLEMRRLDQALWQFSRDNPVDVDSSAGHG